VSDHGPRPFVRLGAAARPPMTEQPAAILTRDAVILAGYDLDMDKQFRHVKEVLSRSHVDDWDALRACRCYTEDTCTLDIGCPFAVNCLAAED